MTVQAQDRETFAVNVAIQLSLVHSVRLLTKTYLLGNHPLDGSRSIAVRWRIIKPILAGK